MIPRVDRLASVDDAPPPTLVNALGKACPVPVIDLAKAVARLTAGAEVIVLADDPGAKVDIPVWCRMKGHRLLAVEPADRGWEFRVQRSG